MLINLTEEEMYFIRQSCYSLIHSGDEEDILYSGISKKNTESLLCKLSNPTLSKLAETSTTGQ